MSRLISYPIISTLSSDDLVIISDSLEASYTTNNVTLETLSSFFDTNSSMWTPVAGGINYSGGNVGVGTVTPGFILDIRGSEAFIENVLTVGDEPDPVTDPTPNGSRVRVIGNSNTSANPGFIAIDKHPNGGETKGVLFAERDSVMVGALTNDPVRIVTNNSEKMTILANGLVGINTWSSGGNLPTKQLTIEGSPGSSALMNLKNYSAVSTQDVFMSYNRDNSDVLGWSTGIYSATDNFHISENGSEINTSVRLCLQAGGNVGIGTSNPGNKFNVIGTGNIGGSDLANSYILAGTITKGIGIDPNEIASKGGVLQIGTLDNKDIIIKANGAEAMRVDRDGNVGIGATNPQGTLHIVGDAGSTALRIDGTTIAEDDIEIQNSGDGVILKSPDGTRYRITVANGGALSVAAV